MSKYLKQNQIKAGMTIYVVHPSFNEIETKFIMSKPIAGGSDFHQYISYRFKPVSLLYIDESFLEISHVYENRNERIGYCGDDGIPNKDGLFSYEQERRAFPTLEKAVAYWRGEQTDENKKRWKEKKERHSAWEW